MEEHYERTLAEKILPIMKRTKFTMTVTNIQDQGADILRKASEFDKAGKRIYLQINHSS